MGYKRVTGVYMILCTTGKMYIGHSVHIKNRWKEHRNRLRIGKHHNIHLQAAYNKYGKESFTYSILEELPYGLLKQDYEAVETKWILRFESNKSKKGFNAQMPGSFPSIGEGCISKKIPKPRTPNPEHRIISINTDTLKIEEYADTVDWCAKNNLDKKNAKYLIKAINYWKYKDEHFVKGCTRSYKGFIFIRAKDYNPDFDYINFKKQRAGGPNLPKF